MPQHINTDFLGGAIWKSKAPTKHAFLLGPTKGKIPTEDMLKSINFKLASMCPMYFGGEEMAHHLLVIVGGSPNCGICHHHLL